MTESRLSDDAFEQLLRASAPEPVPDDGFVARTMASVDAATHRLPVRRRATPTAPLAIARALAAEHARHASQARLWHWAFAGVVAGFALLLLAVTLAPSAPDALTFAPPPPAQWLTLCFLMAAGAIWLAISEWRSN